jgi:hypothetical protein
MKTWGVGAVKTGPGSWKHVARLLALVVLGVAAVHSNADTVGISSGTPGKSVPAVWSGGDSPPLEAQRCGGKCLNPHPYQFKSWYGQANGCWVQVWRQWTDGCTHYQSYDKCHNVWDLNPDRTPRVNWTCCVH